MSEMYVTWGDIISLVSDLKQSIKQDKGRFISRTEAESEIGRKNLEYAFKNGYITKIQGFGKNAKIIMERSEYEAFITLMRRNEKNFTAEVSKRKQRCK